MKRIAGVSAIACLLLLGGFYVWPTVYRPLELQHNPWSDVITARENRFTGAIELLTMTGWHKLGPRAQPTTAQR